MQEIGLFTAHGLLGGILWLFVNWQWTKKAIAQHTIVSAISGYLYWCLYSEYNFPNTIMAIVCGYFSVDFVKQIMESFGKKARGRVSK